MCHQIRFEGSELSWQLTDMRDRAPVMILWVAVRWRYQSHANLEIAYDNLEFQVVVAQISRLGRSQDVVQHLLAVRGIRVKSPSAKSPPGKVNASQFIAHQLNAVWSQVAASRYERHYDADKCIIVRRKRLYYAVVTSKYILEVHLPWICVIKCQRGGNRRVVFTKRTQSYRYRAESTTFCANRWSHNKTAISVTDNIAE